MSRSEPTTDVLRAQFEAQKLAFSPLVFQACRVARDRGVLALAHRSGSHGVSADDVARERDISPYAARLLLEGCLAAGLLDYENDRFVVTKVGLFWEKDELTRVNADFSHHVCYRGAFHLADALRDGIPAGLRELGDFRTIYDGLSSLTPNVRRAWFEFDHYHSSAVFDTCLEDVLRSSPRRLVDVGGNTGKFARLLAERAPDLHVALVDLPSQIALAEVELADLVALGRVELIEADQLATEAELPAGADVYWMSQFLDCFAEPDIVRILERARRAMGPDSRLFVLETFWNEQRFEAARFCVIATSLYFACIANGNSRMYHSSEMIQLLERAGLVVEAVRHEVGLAHSLLRCRRA